MPISRLHASDIATGKTIVASHLNDEFNQLVSTANSQDADITALESDTTALKSGNLTITGNKTFSGTTTLAACIPTLTGTPDAEAELGWNSTTKSIQVHNGTAVGIVETTLNQGFIILQDQKASGTDGGTFTSAAWRTRDLNTEVVDTGNHCTLAANQFTLAAGTYRIEASASGYSVGGHKLRLQNITDASTTLTGNNTVSTATGANTNNTAYLTGRFTIAASKTFEIQHQCGVTKTTNGFGLAHSFASTLEIYTTVVIVKEAE